jgi:hypothetical protein
MKYETGPKFQEMHIGTVQNGHAMGINHIQRTVRREGENVTRRRRRT